jgi:hypothetical protein
MEVVELKPEISVGSVVTLKTELAPAAHWVVVKVGRWWRRGQMLLRRQTGGSTLYSQWSYVGELRKVQ